MAAKINDLDEYPIELLLLGKSGNGKSATGNSILGKASFPINETSTESASDVVKDSKIHEGVIVTVVDGLNICASGKNGDIKDVLKAMRLAEHGLSAFLFIFKFGEKCDRDEVKVRDMIKAIFGAKALKNYGICVLTNGDKFIKASQKDMDQLELVRDWFESQTGPIAELYKECGRRCVLFDNECANEKQKQYQFRSLIGCVKEIYKITGLKRYTYSNFDEDKVSESKEKLISTNVFYKLSQKTQLLLDNEAKNLQNGVDLNSIQTCLKEHLQKIERTRDLSPDDRASLKTSVEALLVEVQSKIKESAFGNNFSSREVKTVKNDDVLRSDYTLIKTEVLLQLQESSSDIMKKAQVVNQIITRLLENRKSFSTSI